MVPGEICLWEREGVQGLKNATSWLDWLGSRLAEALHWLRPFLPLDKHKSASHARGVPFGLGCGAHRVEQPTTGLLALGGEDPLVQHPT